ncbi:hypothetical protein D3C85_1422370 [compost metagenome]
MTWNERFQDKLIILHTETAEAVNDRHPGSRHTCSVAAVFCVIVVVIEIQSCGTQVHLVSLLLIAKLTSQDGVQARRQGGLMNS